MKKKKGVGLLFFFLSNNTHALLPCVFVCVFSSIIVGVSLTYPELEFPTIPITKHMEITLLCCKNS